MSQSIEEMTRLIFEKSLQVLQNLEHQPERLFSFFEEWFELSRDQMAWMSILSNHPIELQQMYVSYWQDAMGLLQEELKLFLEGKMMPSNDKRFSEKEWILNPFFRLLTQHYLLAREHATSLLEHLNFHDNSLAKRVKFFTGQFLDALSPDNFWHTNPHLMAETLQSHGRNLLQGLQNLLNDFEAGSSRLVISMTDKAAFKVGGNLAVTPGFVIYRNSLMELIQYTPQTAKVKSIPLLIIPPWINKYYILDLSPHNSLVRWLVSQGITVFIISWVNPGKAFANKGLFDYLHDGPITAIQMIQKQLGVPKVNALGFCIGGTLLAMLLAYQKAKRDESIHSATFLASLIDFSEPGDISVFIDERQIAKLEKHMKKTGFLEGHLMASAFNSLRASDLIWAFFIRNYLHGKPPVPFDLLFWNTDTTNMPARMHSEYLRWMYLQNDLIKPGKIILNGTPLDLSDIHCPTFFVSTKKDHIAPWQATYEGFRLMRGKKQFLLGGSGHIAGIVIPPGGEKYGYYVNPNPLENADEWLAHAKYHTGSWWPVWLKWLMKASGHLVSAPDFSKLPLQPLMDAPGSYVVEHGVK